MSEPVLVDHPFTTDFEPDHIEILEACVVGTTTWKAGQSILLRGDPADQCHLLVDGTIAIEIRAPGSAPKTILTLYGGELLGWSWLFEPRLWNFDARAVEDSSAITLDTALLQKEIEDDCAFGLVLVRRVTKAIVNRLKATRLQVLDVYNR
jgi:CRP-like cAMP-binding protein